jgi:hypothetical protein
VAKIRNVSGNDLIVPSLGGRLVLAGQVIEVAADDVYAFTQQYPNWEPADKPAQTVHAAAEAVSADDTPPAVPPAANDTPES